MILYDIIGYIAVVFSILGFITSDRKKMLVFGIVSTLLFGFSIYGYG